MSVVNQSPQKSTIQKVKSQTSTLHVKSHTGKFPNIKKVIAAFPASLLLTKQIQFRVNHLYKKKLSIFLEHTLLEQKKMQQTTLIVGDPKDCTESA